MSVSRRRFLQQSAYAVGGVPAVALSPRVTRTQVSPSDKIVVGVVGCNGMGFADLQSLLKIDEVECGALCDVDASVLKRRVADVETLSSVTPKTYGDYRALLDNRDIDAVVIGTPDH